jgi:hypothetical protein
MAEAVSRGQEYLADDGIRYRWTSRVLQAQTTHTGPAE